MTDFRKTKVPVKLPGPIQWLLTNATGAQLDTLHRLSNSHEDFKQLIALFEKFKDYAVYDLFRADVHDDRELSLRRAAARGQTAAYDAFIYAAQAAQDEIKRRKSEKEKVK